MGMATQPELEVRYAALTDDASWMTLVGEVEPLFGPMPDFRAHLVRGIARRTAYVVCGADESVAGAMPLSGSGRARINWLAVRKSARRQGVGSCLVRAALTHFGPERDLLVDTFGDDNAAGRPARLLYTSFGFLPAEDLEPGPEGGSRQRLRRPGSPRAERHG